LQKLYESEEYISNLRHFTERFQTRFVEMATSDADRSVRVATIVLLDNIRQRDLLEPEDVDKISLMIFDPESRIRKAVVSIFLSNVDAQYEETLEGIGSNVEAVEKELGDDLESADGIPHTWLKFNALVKVLAKYDQQVAEETEEDETDKVPYKGFELGEVESRIVMASSAIISEMDELHVPPFFPFLTIELGQLGFIFTARPFFTTQRTRKKRK
jgi:cohesin complex subunit SA-1/2